MNKKNYVLKFFRFAYKSYKPYLFIALFNCILKALRVLFNTYSISYFISLLEKGNYNDAIMGTVSLVFINLVFYFFEKLINKYEVVGTIKIDNVVQMKLSEKMMKVKYEYLEDPYYLDLKERAVFAIENQEAIKGFLQVSTNIIQGIFTLIGLITIISMFDYILLIIVSMSIVINIFAIIFSYKSQIKFYQDLIPINRKYGYYNETLLDFKKAKDYRFYSIANFMEKKYENFSNQTVDYFHSLNKKLTVLSCLTQICKSVEMALIYSFVTIKTLANKLPIATFSLNIGAAISLDTELSNMVDNIFTFKRYLQYIIPFIELTELKTEEEKGNKILLNEKIHKVEFRHVTFAYPKTNQNILEDINFIIEDHQKIAIVGLNGAGKTTMIKLLCRLFFPTSGTILINDTPIENYEINSYFNAISAVFQDYKLFAFSLKDNIVNEKGTEKEAYDIAVKVGLKDKIDKLPLGLNSTYS